MLYRSNKIREQDKRQMNKQSLPGLLVLFLMAILYTGCQPASPGVAVVGRQSAAGCYQVDFLGMTESSEVASTWRYRVQKQSCEQTISNWMLELPACATVVDASPGSWEVVSADLNYQISGIKWQTGTDLQDAEFSVTLMGDLETGMTRAGMEGQALSIDDIDGPVCKERASTGRPTAKVTVQSANCRAKPLGGADKVTVLYRNQEAEIVGRNEDPNNPWWYVEIPDQGRNCWLWSKTTTTTGNVDGLPIIK